jgi:cytochrome c oxidase cbb3-type subunit 1
LVYSFVDTVLFSHFPYIGRAFGGLLYVSGMFVMAYNVYKTIKSPAVQHNVVLEPTPGIDTATTKV